MAFLVEEWEAHKNGQTAPACFPSATELSKRSTRQTVGASNSRSLMDPWVSAMLRYR
jgi:hypothetical protein